MGNSEFSIDNVWLKKAWEISSPSGKDPIKLQVKRNQIYNIRPCIWYSNRLKFQPFTNKKKFLKAISETHKKYPQCDQYQKNWLKIVNKKYFQNTGVKL